MQTETHNQTHSDELVQVLQSDWMNLRRYADRRMGTELRQRISPSDVVQEAALVATNRFDKFDAERPMSIQDWLRFLTRQTIGQLRRFHLQAARRSLNNEQAHGGTSSSGPLDPQDPTLSPSNTASQVELHHLVMDIISSMSAAEQEILQLRFISGLSVRECADRLAISEAAAGKRYLRAVDSLKQQTSQLSIMQDSYANFS